MVDTCAPPSPNPLLGPLLERITARGEDHLHRWITRARKLRGCANPIRLTGETLRMDATTGEIHSHYTSESEPHGELWTRCNNRRASRCASCSAEYRADTYHLIKAGVAGGDKGVPPTVGAHPRVFATLTAPSFGPVHRGPGSDGRTHVCHPRRQGPACFKHHRHDDPDVGQPLDPLGYDYIGHVLWHGHAGELWRRFTIYLRNHLAAATGLSRSEFNRQVRLSYAKVAEYQTRGVIHFHTVLRLDGYTTEPGHWPAPPPWATTEMLAAAVDSAARAVRLDTPRVQGRVRTLTFGEQTDVRPVTAFGPEHTVSDTAVAGYIAKYATKAAETTGTLDRRIRDLTQLDLDQSDVRPHAARLIYTCWRLGNSHVHPELQHLRLRQWAHMLGFRGHVSTKSRRYSTTLGALRQARANYAAQHPRDSTTPASPVDASEDTTLVLSTWRYVGQGLTPDEMALATLVASHTLEQETGHG